jgi:hypothetical protein
MTLISSPCPLIPTIARDAILMTHRSGAVAVLSPLTPTAAQHLGAVQGVLTGPNSPLTMHAGMGFKAYRAVDDEYHNEVVDMGLVGRLWDLGTQVRGRVLEKAGCRGYQVREAMGRRE